MNFHFRIGAYMPLSFDPKDFGLIFSDEVKSMDARYSEPWIYKYYYFSEPAGRQRFLARPTVKFAHKDELIDPFELTRRWLEFGSPFTKEAFDKYIRLRFEEQLSDPEFLVAKSLREFQKRGVLFSAAQMQKFLASPEMSARLAIERQNIPNFMDAMGRGLEKAFRDGGDEIIEKFARETGILSLTTKPDDHFMWNEYAGRGHGFVIQFNAQHEFFLVRKETGEAANVLRRVIYRDDRIDDFWHNPFYLFLVKERKYNFENEWRMLKALNECEMVRLHSDRSIYLMDMPKGLIQSIILGFSIPADLISEYAEPILNFDRNIRLQQAKVDRERKQIEIVDV